MRPAKPHPFRSSLLIVVLALAAACPGSANTVTTASSAGRLEWATFDRSKSTAGSTPTVYQLDCPIASTAFIQQDEYGMLYVMDRLRWTLTRLALDGTIDAQWRPGLEGDGGPSTLPRSWFEDYQDSGRMSLTSGGRICLATYFNRQPAVWCVTPDGTRKISLEKPDAMDGVQVDFLAALEDGRFCTCDKRYWSPVGVDGGVNVVCSYSAAGKIEHSWRTPVLAALAVGPDGRIYGASRERRQILIYDDRGTLERTIDLRSLLDEYVMIPRIAVDRNGDIYLAVGSPWIVRLDASGKYLTRWNAYDARRQEAVSLGFADLSVRNGVVFAAAGRAIEIEEIQAYTPDGQCVARYIPRKPDLELPSLLAIHEDGTYAVVHEHNYDAERFDSSGKPLGQIKGGEYVRNSIIARPGGGYFVNDAFEVRAADPSGRSFQRLYAGNGKVVGGMVDALARDPVSGELWGICANLTLCRFGADGKLIRQLTQNSPWRGITSLAVDSRGVLYACNRYERHERERDIISKFDFEGRPVSGFGRHGSGLGELNHPRCILLDDRGNLLVADTGNSRIQAFSPDGKPLGAWGQFGKGDGELNRPMGIAFGPGKTLWMADTFNDRMVKLPLSRFWKELTKVVRPEPAPQVAARQPAPAPGSVTVTGGVTAGTDDFTDAIYIESSDRVWGMRVNLPPGRKLLRGSRCRVVGTLVLKERGTRQLTASSVEVLPGRETIAPYGMAGLYAGDGYDPRGSRRGPGNLGLLVRVWGRVTGVDPASNRFFINDGSFGPSDSGLEVYAGSLVRPLGDWPRVGQYVGVTGISTARTLEDGSLRSAIRVRDSSDIEVLASASPPI